MSPRFQKTSSSVDTPARPRQVRLRYSATLEFDEAMPQTVRGEIAVANPRLGARRAAEALFKAYPGRAWRSLVVVLERLPQP